MRTFIGFIYKIGYWFMRKYWFVRRPQTQGVRCVITNSGNILLIRHSYGNQRWNIPGGGIKKGETLEQAVLREVKEEVGLEVKNLTSQDSLFHTTEHKRDTVHVFTAISPTRNFIITSPEISEAAWFSFDALPEDTAPLLERFLALVQWS